MQTHGHEFIKRWNLLSQQRRQNGECMPDILSWLQAGMLSSLGNFSSGDRTKHDILLLTSRFLTHTAKKSDELLVKVQEATSSKEILSLLMKELKLKNRCIAYNIGRFLLHWGIHFSGTHLPGDMCIQGLRALHGAHVNTENAFSKLASVKAKLADVPASATRIAFRKLGIAETSGHVLHLVQEYYKLVHFSSKKLYCSKTTKQSFAELFQQVKEFIADACSLEESLEDVCSRPSETSPAEIEETEDCDPAQATAVPDNITCRDLSKLAPRHAAVAAACKATAAAEQSGRRGDNRKRNLFAVPKLHLAVVVIAGFCCDFRALSQTI